MPTSPNYYEILQVSPNADTEMIEFAYQRLAEKWHPDRNPGDPFAHERIKLLNEAYEVLSDPRKRRAYDSRSEQSPPSAEAPKVAPQDGVGETRPVESQSQTDRQAIETVSSAAWVMCVIGMFLFVMGHGGMLLGAPVAFLGLCAVWLGVFGIPAHLCYKSQQRTGLNVVAALFLLAGAVDVGYGVYERQVINPRMEKLQTERSQSGDRIAATNGQSNTPTQAGTRPTEDAQAFIDSGLRVWAGDRRHDDAIQDFSEAIRLDPSSTFAYYNRGEVWRTMKEYDKAIKDFNEVIRLDPANQNHDTVFAYRGRAEIWWKRVEYEKAIQDFSEAIKLDPNDADLYADRGRLRYVTGDRDAALRDYDEAIRLSPKVAEFYGFRAFMLSFHKFDYDKAIQDYSEAIRLEPMKSWVRARYYSERSSAWEMKKNLDKAMEDINAAISLDSQNAKYYSSRAAIWSGKKDFHKQLEDLNTAIKLDPNNASLYSSRADAWAKNQVLSRAIEDHEAAIRLTKDDPLDRIIGSLRYDAFAVLLATCPNPKVRDGKRAIQLATKACELSEWKFHNVVSTLAAAYAEDGQFAEAVRYQQKVLESPDFRGKAGDEYRRRLELYKQGKPLRKPIPDE